MGTTRKNLVQAEAKALRLFNEIEKRGLIKAGRTEEQLNSQVFNLAFELFGIEKYWHKRIVRSGKNTLAPYHENPPNLMVEEDDILFFDFGPVFEDWEADFGRTYVLGNDPYKIKLKEDIETAWYDVKRWYDSRTSTTGAQLYNYAKELATQYGWTFGGEIAGHIIGLFPHEKINSENFPLYVHPKNNLDMHLPDPKGNKRHWILEIHFVDTRKNIGGFFEQLLTS